MTRTDLIRTILATFLFVGSALAQNSVTSNATSSRPEKHLVTPEDVLSIREPRELQNFSGWQAGGL